VFAWELIGIVDSVVGAVIGHDVQVCLRYEVPLVEHPEYKCFVMFREWWLRTEQLRLPVAAVL